MEIPRISFHPQPPRANYVFSVLIPSWNNLTYLQKCIDSLRKNSSYRHQIIVHVNEGIDGTLEWVKDQGLDYSYSEKNAGVCYGFNSPATLATTDYVVLSDDDFYFAPAWDEPLWQEIQSLNHAYFCISGTMMEHSTSTNRCALAPYNYGTSVDSFDETRFLREHATVPFHDWTGGNWYPMVLHKKIWQLIGGLSTEFSPGMGSDPDMMMKLWEAGVRYYKGICSSRVYHFISRSTARVKKNDGHTQFLLKWGMSISTFYKTHLRMGEKFEGPTPEAAIPYGLILKDKLKRWWYSTKNARV
ncbi:MAG: glycosyltransferase family 2 protein [Cyclobacteriaceae bacterium]|jgi:glycosyltransferase involved in cell wall biosynthesis